MVATGRILVGNLLFVVCCVFYLIWWLLGFHPSRPAAGGRFAGLLVPAVICGLAGLVLIVAGLVKVEAPGRLFPNWWLVPGAVLLYLVLLMVTRQVFDRPVTSELLLIVVWSALALAEVNSLGGAGLLSRPLMWAVIVILTLVLVADLVCYVLYYRLGPWPQYIDGMVPLVLTALVMAGLGIRLAAQG